MQYRLSSLKRGQTAIIERFTDPEVSLKLIELGCLPGSVVTLIRKAPLGDPIAISCAGSLISLRRNEAATVLLQPVQHV